MFLVRDKNEVLDRIKRPSPQKGAKAPSGVWGGK
jgi:hypothetical protein